MSPSPLAVRSRPQIAVAPTTTSVTWNVSSSDNDGSMNVPSLGDFSAVNTALVAGWNFTSRSSWIRYDSIPDLTGKTILTAILRVTLSTGNASGCNTIIYANKEAASVAPTSNADYAGKTVTTASQAWVSPSGTSGTADSPDFAPVIQELVDTYGASLTSIMILHKNNEGSDVSKDMHYKAWDQLPFGSASAQLLLTYV